MSIKEFLKNKLQDNSKKYAKWVKDENEEIVHCPLCGQIPLMGIVKTPYCPWCGAMMEDDLKPNEKKVTWETSPSGFFKKCSGCHSIASPKTPFCPQCGAKTDYWKEEAPFSMTFVISGGNSPNHKTTKGKNL